MLDKVRISKRYMSATPALGRLRQMDHSDLTASLGYLVSARLAWAIKENVVLKQ